MNLPKTLVCGVFAGALGCVGCNSNKDDGAGTLNAGGVQTISVEPGVAGGTIEETLTASAVVTSIDAPRRRVQLRGPNGEMAMFTAGPEIRNFDQVREGDTVTATLVQRLVVYVDMESGEKPSSAYAAALARAPKGSKPGAFAAETYEIVATVKAIDAAARTATLLFVDGKTEMFPVRPDVDLARYHVGNTVIIRATSALKLLAKSAS